MKNASKKKKYLLLFLFYGIVIAAFILAVSGHFDNNQEITINDYAHLSLHPEEQNDFFR
jgi:hypothetical protein